ncbi:MAG: hypothetical protein IJ247_03970 [Bacilli bacterium]|nr:hypothetical protein [Bacilli bacterium]
MKKSNKFALLTSLFFFIFASFSLPTKRIKETKASDEWETVETKALPSTCTFIFDASDAYMFFALETNDYTSMGSDNLYVGSATYYDTSDYNFLSYIELSSDNVTYIPFSTIYFNIDFNFFFKDGQFRFGIRRNASTIREDCTYEYIRVLQGCEFPSYDYCVNGGTKKKFVQKDTAIAKLSRVNEFETAATSVYSEYTPKKQVTYTGIAAGWNNANYGDITYNSLILKFGQHGADYLADSHVADATNQATSGFDIGKKLTINGLPIYKIREKYGNTKVGYDHGYCYFYVNYPKEILLSTSDYLVPTIHIEAGAEFMDSILPEVTLKLAGNEWIASTASDFKIDDPVNINSYSLVTFPHHLGTDPHPVFSQLPSNGCGIRFNIEIGDTDLADYSNQVSMNIDGLYKCILNINFTTGTLTLFDKENNNAIAQSVSGYAFAPNSSYSIEMEIRCGETTVFSIAINHLLMINYEFASSKAGECDVWVVDNSGYLTFDAYSEPSTYKPSIIYGGTSIYNFKEGDPVYNFVGVVDASSLYDDTVSYANIHYEYEDGAVSDGKYNAGEWTLNIILTVDGYEPITKTIIIKVSGLSSMAKIYYDDGEPIEVPIGSKLTPPDNPSTYREGEYDYVFDGWYFEGAKWDFENDVVQGDMHLESRFKQTTPHYIVTVIFEGIERASETYSLTKGSSLPFIIFELEGATYEVYYGENRITSLVVQDDITITVKYVVVFTYIDPSEATCTEDGNIGYWYSPVYGDYYFADPEGREQIEDPIIHKFNHDIVHLDYEDSSCAKVGNKECYFCPQCGKHFVDENGEEEMLDWAIPKKAHILTHHDAVEPSCEENGYLEHWTCANEPGVYYGDEACTFELETIVISPLGHEYEAPTYTWTQEEETYRCIASIKCGNCDEEIAETATATKVVLSESTCSKEGEISLSVRFEDERFSAQTKIMKTPMTPHKYVLVEEVKATSNSSGVKEHYECSECNRCFTKNGEVYTEVQYADLLIKFSGNSSGCGGAIEATSVTLFFVTSAFATLLVARKRKEER